jgi:hypothetical protein
MRVLQVGRVFASCVGVLLLLVGAVAGVVNREVLDADRFAAHVDAVRTDPDVARQFGVLLTDRLIEEQPDLVAIRPLIEATAASVVASSTLGPVVRGSVSPLYDALVLGESDPVVLRLADVAAVVVAAVSVLAPSLTVSVPPDLDVRLSDIGAGNDGTAAVRPVHLVALLAWLAPLLGMLLLATVGALGASGHRLRGALVEIGRGALGAGALLAALLVLAGALMGRSDRDTMAGAVRAATWDELAGTFWVVAGLIAAAGAVLALIAGPRTERSRTLLRASLMAAVGLAVVIDPVRVGTALLWVAGAGLLLMGVVTAVVVLARAPTARIGAIAAAGVLVAGVVIGAWPSDHELDTIRAVADGKACNGHVELCKRAYDDVAYPATHNSMAAANESGWFFPEQPIGIIDQLDSGVRVLLIDSWYGRETNRPGVVTTVGEARERAVVEANLAFGEAAVRSALRLQQAVGLSPRGPTKAYLCHGLCEVGSTPWRENLDALRGWLDAHPREVVTLFIQDEVSPADTAALFREAGLMPDVYTPTAGGDWPTLGQMVESGKRLVVLMERHGGGTTYPWLLQGFDWVQDTPFLFRRPAALIEGQDTCAHNRGKVDAPLLLVNHWITDKTAEVSNARRVNGRDVLGPRLEKCRQERGMLPNFVAVDFYDRGDLFNLVDALNGLSD